MAYVQITREELEAWLESLPYPFSRNDATHGIYLIHFSNHVSCKLSSTVTGANTVKDYALASMKLSLVGRQPPHKLLNKKAADRSHFKRTTNWKKTWAEGVKYWHSVYVDAQTFYDKIAQIEDKEKYISNWIDTVESIGNWRTVSFLADIHTSLQAGRVLSDKQEQAIRRMGGDYQKSKTWVLEPSNVGSDAPQVSFEMKGGNVIVSMMRDSGSTERTVSSEEAAKAWADLMSKGYRISSLSSMDEKVRPPFLGESAPGKPALTPQQEAFLVRLDILLQRAEQSADMWLVEFIRSIKRSIGQGKSLSDRQREVLRSSLTKYRVASLSLDEL